MTDFQAMGVPVGSALRAGVALSGIALSLLMTGAASGAATADTAASTELAATLDTTQPGGASAQPASGDKDQKEIVVTGTSLRGIAPAGAESLNLSNNDVISSGATSTQGLLTEIPQLNSFGTTPYAGVGGTQLSVDRVDLRNLPDSVADSSPTLVLVDGHRIVGDGVRQSAPDPGVIPPGLIDHVEVIMDGGSSVYGADAIGGVINFVTKKDFDGFQASTTHGFGDQYNTTNVDLLAGKKWDSGSFYVGYSYAYNSDIKNADRSYEAQLAYPVGATAGVPVGVQCNAGNVQVGGSNYAITSNGIVAGGQNLCDTSKYGDMFPQETRHSVMAGLRQDITPSLELDVKGFYSFRRDVFNGNNIDGFTATENGAPSTTYPYAQYGIFTPVIVPATPGYMPVTPGSTATESVSGNLSAFNGNYDPQTTRLSTWGITPKLNWEISQNWHMTAFWNYGESTTTIHQGQLNTTLLNSDVSAGTFNPYDPGAASNAAVIPALLDYENYGFARQTMNNAKLTVDGTAFHLPGGDVKVAAGAEYLGETYRGIFNAEDTTENTVNTALNPLSHYKRHEWSGFGEVDLPLFPHFNIDAQERYDRYSDFGGNWAPSLGASFKPVPWINLRGKWNKSFEAPSPAALAVAGAAATEYAAAIVQAVPYLHNTTGLLGTLGAGGNAGGPGGPGYGPLINIAGTNPALLPERATTYDLGFDITPAVTPGLALHLTYFNIDFKGEISAPPAGSTATYFTQYPSTYAMNPSYAEVVAIMTAAGVSSTQQAAALANAGCTAAACSVYAILNGTTTNLGGAKVSGLDLGFDYKHAVPFGAVYAKFNGTYLLNYQTSPSPGAAYTPNGVGSSASGQPIARFDFTATAGALVGEDLRAQIKWNHIGAAGVTGAGLGQTSQGAFNTFDIFAKYDLKQGHLPPISFTLGVTNLFDTNPPVFNGGTGDQNGYADSTLGRVVTLGASVKF